MITAINAVLITEANRLDQDLYQNSLHTSPWIDLIPSGEWTDEIGEAVSTIIYERNLPSSQTWTKISSADSSGKSILPTVSSLTSAKTLHEYYIQHTAIESEKLNLNDLRFSNKRAAQLSAIKALLVDNTNWLFQTSNRQEYVRLCTNKLVVTGETSYVDQDTASVALGTDSVPKTVSSVRITPTELTNAVLGKLRQKMIRAGAGKNPWDRIDGAPLFAIVCDSEVSDALKLEAGIREDLRFAGRANELLTPLGVERPYKNFYHLVDDIAPRFTQNSSTGVFTEIAPYVTSAEDTANSKFGARMIPNAAYETAPFTDTIILHKDVMMSLYPKGSISGGSGVSFNPVEYRGSWRWVNEINMDTTTPAVYNPDGTIGFFRGTFARGSKPIFPDYGYQVRHLRPGYTA